MDEGVSTPESTAAAEDLKTRQDGFVKEYQELTSKWKIDYASYPMWIPDGAGAFKCIIQSTPIDITNKSVPSDFMETNK